MNALPNLIKRLSAFLLGAVFVFSGIIKASDPIGTITKFQEYFNAFEIPAPSTLSYLLAFFLIGLEFVIGTLLLLAVFKRISFKLLAAFVAFFTLLTLVIALTDRVTDCGCFGDFLKMSNWETFGKNIVLSGLTWTLYKLGYPKETEWLPLGGRVAVVLLAAATISGYQHHTYTGLPTWDFRPYKVGTDLLSARQEAEVQEKTSFIYEKNGQKQRFEMEALPDSTWTWVETITEAVETSEAQNTYDSFSLLNDSQEDVSQELLEHEQVGLVVLREGQMLDTGAEQEALQQFIEATEGNGGAFYFVTSGEPADMYAWQEERGYGYEVLFADVKLLKTIIRANPGFVTLENGVITQKQSLRNFGLE